MPDKDTNKMAPSLWNAVIAVANGIPELGLTAECTVEENKAGTPLFKVKYNDTFAIDENAPRLEKVGTVGQLVGTKKEKYSNGFLSQWTQHPRTVAANREALRETLMEQYAKQLQAVLDTAKQIAGPEHFKAFLNSITDADEALFTE